MEDFIYSCGASFPSKILCTSPEMTCGSSVETTYYKVKFNPKPVCMHCRAEDTDVASQKETLTKYKIIFPVCFACCHSRKKEVVVEKSKRTGAVNKSSSLIRCAAPSQSSRGDHRENVNMVVENVEYKRKQATLPFIFSVAEKKKSVCVEGSDEESNNEDSEVPCSIYNDADDPTETPNIT